MSQEKSGWTRWSRVALLAGAMGLGSSCAPAVVVGAGAVGAVGAIAYTDRGAKGDVQGTPDDVRRNTEAVFRRMGIATTGYEMKNGGVERNLKGQSTTAEVTVNIVATSPTTSRVEVDAKEGTLNWNKDYARQVLTRIVQMG
ncbi:MAG: hypothetical protein JST54_05545 [Deltaproteobacteria bacterium]|nr:hypothetical protein [Deltaproteobacteria bacterium]